MFDSETVVTIDQQYLTLIVGILLPLLVGLVTTRVTKTGIQRILLLVLSIVAGVLTQAIENDGTFILEDSIIGAIITYLTAQTAYSSVLKPLNISQKVQEKTQNVGVVIAASPEKEAALAAQVSTAGAVAAVGGGDALVAPLEPVRGTDVPDVAPDPAPSVGDPVDVIDADSLPAADPDGH